jgi:hypothetical protein
MGIMTLIISVVMVPMFFPIYPSDKPEPQKTAETMQGVPTP